MFSTYRDKMLIRLETLCIWKVRLWTWMQSRLCSVNYNIFFHVEILYFREAGPSVPCKAINVWIVET